MRAKFLLRSAIGVLGMGLAFYGSEASADDVYVDLSVLDALGTANSPVINSAPLFPVVTSAPQFPEVKKAPAKKKAVKKTSSKKAAPVKIELPAPKATETTVHVPEEKINIPGKEDITVDIPVKETTNEVLPSGDLPFAVETETSEHDETSAAPIAPVDVTEEKIPENDSPAIMEAIDGQSLLPKGENDGEISENDEMTPVAGTSSADMPEKEGETLVTAPSEKESLFALTESQAEEKQDEEKTEEKRAPQPLIDNAPYDTAPVLPLAKQEIVFAEDSDELTDADKQKIDEIISSFENPQENKIAIYSYNLETGKDSFYRKRMSLNRAVGVRSYLLGKGYKNFSIKVINIAEGSEKNNSVSIEELK